MRIARITKHFYRIYWEKHSKDVLLNSLGVIVEPVNPYNVLTESEKQIVEIEIKKDFKK